MASDEQNFSKLNSGSTGQRAAWGLAFLGIAPIVILAAMLGFTPRENALYSPLMDAFKTCSAIGLSFLGGIRWGMELQTMNPKKLAASILPAIIAWGCLFIPEPLSIGLLLIGVAALGAWDTFSIYDGAAPHWYARLRSVLTLIAALAHMIVLATAF